MNQVDPKIALLEVFAKCQKQLPEKLGKNITIPGKDPAPLKKKDTDILRMRLLPIKKSLTSFWNTGWCFYEVGVGSYGGKLTVGGVSFVQFPFQKACGGGQYLRPVISILEKLQNDVSGFELTPASYMHKSTQLQRLYRNRDFPFFPVDQAARDLAWLVEKTLPAFEGIKF